MKGKSGEELVKLRGLFLKEPSYSGPWHLTFPAKRGNIRANKASWIHHVLSTIFTQVRHLNSSHFIFFFKLQLLNSILAGTQWLSLHSSVSCFEHPGAAAQTAGLPLPSKPQPLLQLLPSARQWQDSGGRPWFCMSYRNNNRNNSSFKFVRYMATKRAKKQNLRSIHVQKVPLYHLWLATLYFQNLSVVCFTLLQVKSEVNEALF